MDTPDENSQTCNVRAQELKFSPDTYKIWFDPNTYKISQPDLTGQDNYIHLLDIENSLIQFLSAANLCPDIIKPAGYAFVCLEALAFCMTIIHIYYPTKVMGELTFSSIMIVYVLLFVIIGIIDSASESYHKTSVSKKWTWFWNYVKMKNARDEYTFRLYMNMAIQECFDYWETDLIQFIVTRRAKDQIPDEKSKEIFIATRLDAMAHIAAAIAESTTSEHRWHDSNKSYNSAICCNTGYMLICLVYFWFIFWTPTDVESYLPVINLFMVILTILKMDLIVSNPSVIYKQIFDKHRAMCKTILCAGPESVNYQNCCLTRLFYAVDHEDTKQCFLEWQAKMDIEFGTLFDAKQLICDRIETARLLYGF